MHEIIKIVAKYFIVLSVIGVAIVFARLGRQDRLRFAALLVLGGVVSYLLAKVGSHLYNDPRPFVQGHFRPLLSHAADNGFPSDHTLFTSFMAWACLVYSRKVGLALLLVAALVGLARMAAGVHHLSDVLASFVFAAVGCFVTRALIAKFYPKPITGNEH